MAIKDFGKLTKLKIKALDKDEEFEVMFNPESYSERFSVEYQKRESANSDLEEYDFVKSIPQDFQLKIIIDGTGVSDYNVSYLPTYKSHDKSVISQVNDFLRITWFSKNGPPNSLTISWGSSFSYDCRLKDVNINYTLFNREGMPLRAELDAKFIGLPHINRAKYERRFQEEYSKGFDGVSNSISNSRSSGDKKAPVKNQNGIVISVS